MASTSSTVGGTEGAPKAAEIGATPASSVGDPSSSARAPVKSGPAPPGTSQPTPGPATTGLHAPALTPGPLAQKFVTLGRYQLLSRLAVGGMAEVYLARQGELSGFKTLVVVKKVLPHLAVNPEFIAMFLDEARIASMLNHPNVVRITEVGRASDEYFLAMELVQGMPLIALFKRGEATKEFLPDTLSALVVANAAAGLHHAHQLTDASGNLLGLVHRDVSPQNIMVSFEGSVKVIDFGIARALGRLGDTDSGALKGKLGYMAPEQARGEPVDVRADIFSLGVVLWECLAARRLFLRDNELATLRAVVYDPIPSVSDFANVDPALEGIVNRALARDRSERFQTAEEIRVALERWVFSAGGASTHDLAALMKSWYAADHLQWQNASRLALDMLESDPPIEVTFPKLAASKPDGDRGANDAGGTKPFGDSSSSRAIRPPLVVPTPTVTEVVRGQLWRRALVPSGIVLTLLAVAMWVGLSSSRRQPTGPLGTGSNSATRPTVQILPGPPRGLGLPIAATPPDIALPNAHVGEATRPAVIPADLAAELAKRKNRTSSSEKRAILGTQDTAVAGPVRGNGPVGAKNNTSKKVQPRPNPF